MKRNRGRSGPRKPDERDWLARKHGTHLRRQYRKFHLAMNTATGDIRGVEFISSREVGSPVLPDLLDQIPTGQVGTVACDGASGTRRRHTAIVDLGGTAVISIRKNGHLWKEECPAAPAIVLGPMADIVSARGRHPPRNPALRSGELEALVRPSCPKSDRRKDALAGSHEPVALNLLGLKSFGKRIASRDPDRQAAEVRVRRVLMNRCNALGIAKMERVACA